MPELSGKLILVTGAASGIGQACCHLFTEEGATVIGADVHTFEDKLVDLCVQCDVTEQEQVTSLLGKISDKYKRAIDGLVHCAGILNNIRGMDGCTEDVYNKVMNTNMKGTYITNKTFADSMKAGGNKGSIVNVSSIGISGIKAAPAYCASKAAQVGWSKSIAKELAKHNIRCNTVHPGFCETAIYDPFGFDLRKLVVHVPLKRLGTPREIAQACLFLTSDRASYITATELHVNGGLISDV